MAQLRLYSPPMMFIEPVPNCGSPPAVLLQQESYRDENGRSQKRTLANLSKLRLEVIEALTALLKGGTVIGMSPEGNWRLSAPCRMGTLRRRWGSDGSRWIG